MSERTTVTYGPELWRKGSRGVLHGSVIPDVAYIENMQVYASGLLGPRPLWKQLPHLGGPLTATNGVIDTEFHGIATHPNEGAGMYRGNSMLLLVTSSNDYKVRGSVRPHIDNWVDIFGGNPLPSLFRTYDDDLPVTQSHPRFDVDKRTEIGDSRIYLAEQSWLLRVHGSGNPIAENHRSNSLPVDHQLWRSTLHHGRMFWYGLVQGFPMPIPNRIYYSDPYAFHTIPSSNFFSVDGEVEGLYSIGTSLFIWTLEGKWFVLQGRGNPADATLFTLGTHKTPMRTNSIAKVGNFLYFIPKDRRGVVRVSADGEFDYESLSHLAPSEFTRGDAATGLYPNQAVGSEHGRFALLAYSRGLGFPLTSFSGLWGFAMYDNYWVNESYFDGIGLAERMDLTMDGPGGVVYLCDSEVSGGTTRVQIYSRDVTLGRPSRHTDLYSARMEAHTHVTTGNVYTADSHGVVRLPRMPARDQQTVRVRNVIMDGRYWAAFNANAPENREYAAPRMACRVRDGAGQTHELVSDGDHLSFYGHLPNTADPDRGAPIRLTFSGDLPFTAWSEVALERIRAFAIERVIVEYEWEAGQPWL